MDINSNNRIRHLWNDISLLLVLIFYWPYLQLVAWALNKYYRKVLSHEANSIKPQDTTESQETDQSNKR